MNWRKKRSGDGSKPPARKDRQLDDIWAEVAERLGGTIVTPKRRRPEIRVPYGPWTIILDKHIVSNGQATVVYTRTRAYFLGNSDFGFRLAKRQWFHRFARFLGLGEVLVGDRALEERFVIRSKSAARVRSLLHDRALLDEILAQPSMRMEVKGLGWWRRRKLGSRVRVVTARTTGVVTDPERLIRFFGLIRSALDQLERIGCARRQSVDLDRHNGEVRQRL